MKTARITACLLALAVATLVLPQGARAQEAEIANELYTKGSYKENAFRKAPKRVFIQEFAVHCQVLGVGSDQSRGGYQFGGSYVGNTKTVLGVGLEGVSLEDLRALTDELYADYVGQLEAAGYELVGAAEAIAHSEVLADWELVEDPEPSAAQLAGYITVTPTGFSFPVRKVTKRGKRKGSVLTDNSPKISGQLGDAVVARVSVLVPFVTFKSGTAINLAGAGSKVKATTGVKLAASATGVVDEKSVGARLGQPAPSLRTYATYATGKGAGATAQGYITTALKKDVAVPGVVKSEKIKESTGASRTTATSFGTNAYAPLFVSVEDRDSRASHAVDAAGATYRAQVGAYAKTFLDAGLGMMLGGGK